MRNLKNVIPFLILLLFVSMFPNLANAHNGARDELGGHFRRADCTYLLHSPTDLARSAKNINELITLIKQNNSNSSCVSNLTPNTINLEGFTFTGSEPTNNNTSTTKPRTTPAPKQVAPALTVGKKYPATLEKCVDGDTANFVINGKMYKTRFLYIDTPEYTTEKEPFGKEASEYTCQFLKQGKITLETDGNDLYDKYDRLLAWVWVDGKLHQKEITMAGLVEDFYDYGDYKYEEKIIAAMNHAKTNFLGIYAANKPAEPTKKEDNTEVENKANSSVDDKVTSEESSKEVTKDKESEKQEPKEKTIDKDEEQIAASELSTDKESGNGYMITGLILAALLFALPYIKYALGGNSIIAYRLRTRKWWINIILFFIYATLWPLILIVIIIELIHLFKNRRRYA